MTDVKLDPLVLKELSKKSLFPWLYDAAKDWVIIGGAIYISSLMANPASFLFAILIVGNRQHAFAVLGHDGTHFTLSQSRVLNDALTNFLTMWPLGLTVSGYRKLHFQHHRATGTDADPELHHKRARAPQWDLPITGKKIAKYVLCDLLGYSIPDYLIIVRFSKPEKTRELLYLAAFHLAAISLLVVFHQWWTLAVWYTSLLTSFMMFFRLRLWLEHQGTSTTNRVRLNRWQGAVLAPHNGWCHWEHHNWANIPYYNLPKVRELVQSEPVESLQDLISGFQSSRPISSGSAPS